MADGFFGGCYYGVGGISGGWVLVGDVTMGRRHALKLWRRAVFGLAHSNFVNFCIPNGDVGSANDPSGASTVSEIQNTTRPNRLRIHHPKGVSLSASHSR